MLILQVSWLESGDLGVRHELCWQQLCGPKQLLLWSGATLLDAVPWSSKDRCQNPFGLRRQKRCPFGGCPGGVVSSKLRKAQPKTWWRRLSPRDMWRRWKPWTRSRPKIWWQGRYSFLAVESHQFLTWCKSDGLRINGQIPLVLIMVATHLCHTWEVSGNAWLGLDSESKVQRPPSRVAWWHNFCKQLQVSAKDHFWGCIAIGKPNCNDVFPSELPQAIGKSSNCSPQECCQLLQGPHRATRGWGRPGSLPLKHQCHQ